MKLELKIQLLKFCSVVFNSFSLVLGLCVVGCAVWILFDQGSFVVVLSSAELNAAALVLLLIGGTVAVASVAGCVGADREQRILLLTYLGFLFILLLGLVFVSLVLLLNTNKIQQSLGRAVDQVVHGYGGSRRQADALMDNVQHYGRCCGRTGPADWLHNSYVQSLNLTGPDVLPCSCFASVRPSVNSSWCSELLNFTESLFGSGTGLFDQGCEQKLSNWLRDNGLTILAMEAGLMIIQVIQVVVTVFLYRAFRKKVKRQTGPDHAPSRQQHDHAPSQQWNDHAPHNCRRTTPPHNT